MEQIRLTVDGMSCTGCEETVVEALETLAVVDRADADHEADEVVLSVEGDLDREEAATAVASAGYTLED